MGHLQRTGTTSANIPELQGDQIFNGAVDNASGVAAVIELAQASTKAKTVMLVHGNDS